MLNLVRSPIIFRIILGSKPKQRLNVDKFISPVHRKGINGNSVGIRMAREKTQLFVQSTGKHINISYAPNHCNGAGNFLIKFSFCIFVKNLLWELATLFKPCANVAESNTCLPIAHAVQYDMSKALALHFG